MEISEAMLENQSLIEGFDAPDFVDTREFMRDTPGFFPSSNGIVASQIYDRDDGRYRPVYQHEMDLKVIRAMSWMLQERVPMGQAWINRLLDYTVGSGFDWAIKHENKQIERIAKPLIKHILDDNDWVSALERESYSREVGDGEFLAVLGWQDGTVEICVREPDELTEPVNGRQLEDFYDIDFDASWSFGILSPRRKASKAVRYHFVADDAGNDWDCVPAWQVLHWKRNVKIGAKRGVTDFYKPHVYLMRADKVFTNTAHGAATQAAISFIVEHAPGTTAKQAAGLLSMTRYVGNRDSITGTQLKTQNMQPGTRIETTNGAKYHAGLLGSNNSQIYIEVMEAGLRMAGTVHAFPEGMLTGTYQNNNMASSQTAENPWKQGRLAEQNHRATQVRQMIMKCLKLAAGHGAFSRAGIDTWDELRQGLTVDIQPARIFTEDPKALSEALAIQKNQGWIDDKSAITELGRDAEHILKEIENQKKQDPQILKQQAMAASPATRDIQDVIDFKNQDKARQNASGEPTDETQDDGKSEKQVTESEDRLLEDSGQARCPAGFTRANPLIINGNEYTGGKYIPDKTQAQVDQAVAAQTAKAEAALSGTRMAQARTRAISMIDRRFPPSGPDMLQSKSFLPVDPRVGDPAFNNEIAAAGYDLSTNGRNVTIPMNTTNLTTFTASRVDLSRPMLIDAINGQPSVSRVDLIKRDDGTYTIVRGSQTIIAAQMLGQPTIEARVVNHRSIPVAPPPPVATVATPADPTRAQLLSGAAATPARVAALNAATPAATTPTRTSHPTFRHPPSRLAAALGAQGWSTADGRRVLRARGVSESAISDRSISDAMSRGRNGASSANPATLRAAEISELDAMRASGVSAPAVSRSGIVAPTTTSRATTPATPGVRPPYPTRNAGESSGDWRRRQINHINTHIPEVAENHSENPIVRVASRSPAQQSVVDNGLREAKQRVEDIKNRDVSIYRPLPRVDQSQITVAHIDPTASPFIRQHGARLTGALPGSTIRINESVVEGDYIRTLVTASGPHGLEMQRKIYEPKVPGVKGHIYNQWFKVDDDAPKGYGLQAFASQVHEAKLLGFEKIKVTAGGGGNHRTGAYPGDMNGYYTWPRFGYSGPLYANGVGDGRYNLPMELRGATSVEHLMTHPKGRDWMRLHGTQTGYEFDLSDGSYNINHLIEYHHSETGGT